MIDRNDYSVDGARQAADRGQLDDWVTRFLASPGSDNAELGEQLASVPRWWLGPVELPLDELHRLAGPPGAPVMREVDEGYWRDDIDGLAAEIADGSDPPPVIVTHQGGRLVLEDGNHRVEGLRRAGRATAWGVVAFDDPDERDRFTPPIA